MARNNFGASERMKIKKKTRRNFEFQIRGRAVIDRYSKDGEYLGQIGPIPNTITAEGFDEFLRLICGTSAQHFNTANASIRLTSTSDPATGGVYEQEGADVGPAGTTTVKTAPSYAVRWEWHDDSVSAYDPNFLHFIFDNYIDGYVFATVDISAAGSKPPTENWHYAFILELYSTDTDFTTGGLQVLMDLFTGTSGLHLTTTGIRLRPTTGAGSGTELTGTDRAPDANPTINTGANTATWVWTVPDGTFPGVWAGTKIKIGTSFLTNLRWGGCKTDGSSCGTKGPGEEWEYTYIFSIVQGSL